MHELDLFELYTQPLNTLGLRYMVTGAAAAIIYGVPRMTHDLDLVLELPAQDLERFLAAFSEDHFYRPPWEVVLLEAGRPLRGHFNLIHFETGFKADVYLIGEDPLHFWAMGRRRKLQVGGGDFWVAPPEYVILRKLQYFLEGGSEKHLKDILGILKVSKTDIDFGILLEWVDQLELRAPWHRIQQMM